MTEKIEIPLYDRVPRSERYLVRVNLMVRLAPWLGIGAIVAMLTFTGGLPHVTRDAVGQAFLLGVFLLLTYGACYVMLFGASIGRTGWLPKSHCGRLADLIDQHPALQPYRAQVVAMGRQFTLGEYYDLLAYVSKHTEDAKANNIVQEREAACKRLYGVEA